MKNILTLIILFSISTTCFANDDLPQNYTPNNINPYKSRNWFNFVNFSNTSQTDYYNDTKKYDLMLSRLEKEWFKQDFVNMPLGERLSHLEEFVFGTSFNEEIEKRCDRLKRAFNAQKNNLRQTKSLFSGMPTSIPFGVDELLAK